MEEKEEEGRIEERRERERRREGGRVKRRGGCDIPRPYGVYY